MSSCLFLCTCRGVYLASLVYSEDSKVLVTVDDQVPIVEVSDSHSSAIGADFVWLAKVSGEEEGEEKERKGGRKGVKRVEMEGDGDRKEKKERGRNGVRWDLGERMDQRVEEGGRNGREKEEERGKKKRRKRGRQLHNHHPLH